MDLNAIDKTYLEVTCRNCGFNGTGVPVLNVYMRDKDDSTRKTVHQVCPKCLMLDELDIVAHEYPKRTVGVIATDVEDFQDWRDKRGHKVLNLKLDTKRKYVHRNTTYVCITRPFDCKGWTFDEIEIAPYGISNSNYLEIYEEIKHHLK